LAMCICVRKGDGTFQISGNRVSLSVVPNCWTWQARRLVGNQQDNSVTVQTHTLRRLTPYLRAKL